MRKHIISLLTLLIISFSLSAQDRYELQFDTLTVKKGYIFQNNHTLYMAYQFIYPTNDTTPIAKIKSQIIRDFFSDEEETDLIPLDIAQKQYEKGIIDDVMSNEPIEKATYSLGQISEEQYSAVRIVNNKVLVFMVQNYWHRGWLPHGGAMSFLTNYDLSTGSNITLDNLFNAEYKIQLLALVNKSLREQYNIPNDFAEVDWLPENFMILPKGLKFYFNEYEIAPYSYGRIDATIKYSEFKHLLKSQATSYFHE